MKNSSCLHFRQILLATFLIPFLPCHGSLAPKQAWSSSTKLTNHTLGVKATHWRKTFTSLSSNWVGHFPGKIYFSELYFFKKFLLPLPVPDPDLEIGGGGRGGDCLFRPLDKGGGLVSPAIFFRPFGPHFGPKIRRNLASRAAPLDSPLFALKLELFCSKLSSCSVFFDFELIINI